MTILGLERELAELPPNLGICCACGCPDDVNNILMLPFKALTKSGSAWGCLQCNLEFIGAIAVICDNCIADGDFRIRFACDGEPHMNRRIRISALTEPHKHDMRKHGIEPDTDEE